MAAGNPPAGTASPARRDATGRSAHTRELLVLALVVIAVLGTALFFFDPIASRPTAEPDESVDTGPDLVITDAIIRSHRASGTLKYLLRSPVIEHYTERDVTYLAEPNLTLYNRTGPPWQIRASKGTIFNAASSTRDDAEAVVLEDSVRMAQRFDDGRHFVLDTPSITVYPELEYAETSRDVMITTHAGRTRAVGLNGNLDQGLLELFSNERQRVHTVILPDQFK